MKISDWIAPVLLAPVGFVVIGAIAQAIFGKVAESANNYFLLNAGILIVFVKFIDLFAPEGYEDEARVLAILFFVVALVYMKINYGTPILFSGF